MRDFERPLVKMVLFLLNHGQEKSEILGGYIAPLYGIFPYKHSRDNGGNRTLRSTMFPELMINLSHLVVINRVFRVFTVLNGCVSIHSRQFNHQL